MLNFPKTGSSFARKVIKKIYANAHLSCYELLLPNVRNLHAKSSIDHHGTFNQIPLEYRNRPVISIMRNPIDRFLSTFMYKAWVDSPPMPKPKVIKLFPNFPHLDVDQFIELQEQSMPYRLGFDMGKRDIGIQSIQLIQMFFKNPGRTLKNIFTGSYSKEALLSEMGNVRFLSQENLRNDLSRFLTDMGLTQDNISIISTQKASNVSNYSTDDKSLMITDRLRAYIEKKEWLYGLIYRHRDLYY